MTIEGATMNIPEEAIEKAARALAGDGMYHPWMHRPLARAALSAAAPTLMAMGYDEGCDEAASSRFDAHECKKYNPYRKEQL